jgi:hypothetical protein
MADPSWISTTALIVAVAAAVFAAWQAVTTNRGFKQHVNEWKQQEKNSLTERKRMHYRYLVEESLREWDYSPSFPSNLLTRRPTPIGGETAQRSPILSDPTEYSYIPYLEEAKSHLKSYPLWELYNDGPTLSKNRDLRYKHYRDEVLWPVLRDGISKKQIKTKNEEQIITTYAAIIGQHLGVELQGGKSDGFPVANTGNSVAVGNIVFEGSQRDAEQLASLLIEIENSPKTKEAYREYVESQRQVDKNRETFIQKLRQEVIEKVKISNYEKMLGNCDSCPESL